MLRRKTLLTAVILLGAVVIGSSLALAQNLGLGPAPVSTPAMLDDQGPVSQDPAPAVLQPEEPGSKPSAQPQAKPPAFKDANQILAETGAAFPGFGGYYLDPNDNSIASVYMLDTSQQEQARQAIESVLDVHGQNQDVREVRVLQGQYSMAQLSQWYAQARSLLSVDGARWTDLDEAKNRIRLGVWDQEAKARIEAEIDRLGIPRAAVVIEINDAPLELLSHELDGEFDPLVGVPRITIPDANASCTFGYVTKQPLPGQQVPSWYKLIPISCVIT